MEIKVTLGATPELLAALSVIASTIAGSKTVTGPSETPVINLPETKKPAAAKPAAPKPAAPKPSAATTDTTDDEEAPTADSIRARAVPLTQAGKKDHIKRALSFYGANKLTELKEADYKNFSKNLNEIEAGTPLVDHSEQAPF